MTKPVPRRVFVTGASGYMGRAVVPVLVERGHQVTALVRPGSEKKLDGHCEIFLGNALDGDSYVAKLRECDTFIHLVGVPHASPAKAQEFVAIDRKAAEEAIRAAALAGIQNFVYVSVAQPAPVMKAYIGVRSECERCLRDSGLNGTILRPWYVVGPGHRWPILLKPLYRTAELMPAWRDGALRLGLVTLREMTLALTAARRRRIHPESGSWVCPSSLKHSSLVARSTHAFVHDASRAKRSSHNRDTG